MSSFYKLLEGLNNHLLQNNCWPRVKISPTFWEKYTDSIVRLRNDGIHIEVVESFRGKFCFVISRSSFKNNNNGESDDLKRQIARLVSEANKDEPVQDLDMHIFSN